MQLISLNSLNFAYASKPTIKKTILKTTNNPKNNHSTRKTFVFITYKHAHIVQKNTLQTQNNLLVDHYLLKQNKCKMLI